MSASDLMSGRGGPIRLIRRSMFPRGLMGQLVSVAPAPHRTLGPSSGPDQGLNPPPASAVSRSWLTSKSTSNCATADGSPGRSRRHRSGETWSTLTPEDLTIQQATDADYRYVGIDTSHFRRTELIQRLLTGRCEMCRHSSGVEVHPVGRLAPRQTGTPQPPRAALMAHNAGLLTWTTASATRRSAVRPGPWSPAPPRSRAARRR
jgi:hypothetical protein